jgi:hypothetical protein
MIELAPGGRRRKAMNEINKEVFLPPIVIEGLRRAREIRKQFQETGEVFTVADFKAAVRADIQDLEKELLPALVDWAVQFGKDDEIDMVMAQVRDYPFLVESLKIARQVWIELQREGHQP